MIKTIKQACRFNPTLRDYRMCQGIENLSDLIHDAGDGREVFSRNYITHDMASAPALGLAVVAAVSVLLTAYPLRLDAPRRCPSARRGQGCQP